MLLRITTKKNEVFFVQDKDFDDLYQYVSKEQGKNFNFVQFKKVTDSWKKEYGYTYSGMLKSLLYFYEIKGNQWEKGHGGLGIVPYVFEDAKAYWVAQERQRHGFMKELENQIKEREVVRVKRSTKKREKYNLDDI